MAQKEYHARINVKTPDNLAEWQAFVRTLKLQGEDSAEWLLNQARVYLEKNREGYSTAEYLDLTQLLVYSKRRHRFDLTQNDVAYYVKTKKLRPKFDFLIRTVGKNKKVYSYKRTKMDRFIRWLKGKREAEKAEKLRVETFGEGDYASAPENVPHVDVKRIAPVRTVQPMVVYRGED